MCHTINMSHIIWSSYQITINDPITEGSSICSCWTFELSWGGRHCCLLPVLSQTRASRPSVDSSITSLRSIPLKHCSSKRKWSKWIHSTSAKREQFLILGWTVPFKKGPLCKYSTQWPFMEILEATSGVLASLHWFLFWFLHQLLLLCVPVLLAVLWVPLLPARPARWWLSRPPRLAGRLCCAHTLYASVCIIKKEKKEKELLCGNRAKTNRWMWQDGRVPLLDFFCYLFFRGCVLLRFGWWCCWCVVESRQEMTECTIANGTCR